MKSPFQKKTSGNAYSDVDISSPELNGDPRCRELERKNCKPPECVIPANSKATFKPTLAKLQNEQKVIRTEMGLRNAKRK
jgi:hypothetical protein